MKLSGRVTASAQPHLVLVNLGTPREPSPAGVREFLAEFLRDPAVVDLPRWLWLPILRGIVLNTRPARVAEQYRSIWTADGSPLRAATEKIAEGVRSRASGRFGASAAYRYGEPSLETVMRTLADDRAGPIIVLPLFPQRTDATTGTAFRCAREAAERAGIADRLINRVLHPADPGYVRALAARWRSAVAEAGHDIDHVVVSYHGIPSRYDRREGRVYVLDCETTTRAFLRAIGWPLERATLAFQSRFGPEQWLKPATARVLEKLPRRGVRRVAVITPGFLTDGLETIEEIGIRGRLTFLEAGGTHFVRVGSVEAEPAFLDAIVSVAARNTIAVRVSDLFVVSGAIDRPIERKVTADLLARHDRPGPRYTSYPTAVEFQDGLGSDGYLSRLAAADRLGEAPLSLYMHLPFCEQRCLFCGCHVIVTKHRDVAASYLELVKREIELLAERLPNRRRLAQLHLGGGTPTYFSPKQLSDLLEHTLRNFRPVAGAELALEADPRATSAAHIDVLADLGFNRISFGVQDLTPEVQQAVNRVQSLEQTAELIGHARRRGFRGINVDLIYGLPLQTPESFERTVDSVIGLGVDRAAVYSFAFVPWVRGHQKKINRGQLPDAATKLALFSIARERFLHAGYEPIGMDHFARPDDDLARAKHDGRLRRNFQGYAVVPGDDVLGVGISAIGDVRGAYVQNEKQLSRYAELIRAGRLPVARGVERTADDEARRMVIQELMCNFRVNMADVSRRFGLDFTSYFADDLALMATSEREGLVKIDKDWIEATPVGELFVRNLAMCFDRYQRERHGADTAPVFSRTV